MRHQTFALALASVTLLLRLESVSAAGEGSDEVLHDTAIAVDAELIAGSRASAYVAVTAARDIDRNAPVRGADVAITVVAEGRTVLQSAQMKTDRFGEVVVPFEVPAGLRGDAELVVETRSEHGHDRIVERVVIVDSTVIHLRTDRPVYRAGDVIRWRATILHGVTGRPLAGRDLALAIRDPRGTLVWRGSAAADASGMVAGELPLGSDLVYGRYDLEVTSGSTMTRRTVAVKDYDPPPFLVELELDDPEASGARSGTVTARYPYGKPVSGRLEVWRDSHEIRAIETRPGTWRFRISAEAAANGGALRARVTDGAGRRRLAEATLPRTSGGLTVEIVPESERLTSGAYHYATVLTAKDDGVLVPADVEVVVGARTLRKRSRGAVRLRFRAPRHDNHSLEIHATARAGDDEAAQRTTVRVEADRPFLRARRSVIDSGQSFEWSGAWPRGRGPVVVTLLRDGTPLASTVAVPRRGYLSGVTAVPRGTFGLLTLRASDNAWDRQTGEQRRLTTEASVFVRPEILDVRIDGAARHRPGDSARATVTVTDRRGRPVAAAALAAQVVDERVLALGEPQPDLVTAVRNLSAGDSEAAGVAFADLLAVEETPTTRAAMRAILDRLPDGAPLSIARLDAARRLRDERVRTDELYRQVHPLLVAHPGAIAISKGGVTARLAPSLEELVVRDQQAPQERPGGVQASSSALQHLGDPWSRPTTWGYLERLQPHLGAPEIADAVASDRLDETIALLRKKKKAHGKRLHRDPVAGWAYLVDRGVLKSHLAVDPWGQAPRLEARDEGSTEILDLRSAGPDGAFDTHDDITREDALADRSYGYGYGSGSGYGTIGHGRGAAAPRVRIGAASATNAPEQRVRRRFDETVLWRVGIRTNARGQATIEIPLADSITGWRVEIDALGASGGVGSASTRLETFQPAFVEVSPPAGLVAGDHIEIPIAVANMSDRPRVFRVGVDAGGVLEIERGALRYVRVDAGETASVSAMVHAQAPGAARLSVALSTASGDLGDRVERSFSVHPPGPIERHLELGELEGESAEMVLEVPGDVVAGSARARLALFRGASDIAIDGIEGMLREPHGCFEQTSSATYPNLLVLDLLRGQDGSQELQARAEELVAKGYQRLLSYEVGGGGFSWFGDAPAHQVLTAYGLIEFADMARVYPIDPDLVGRTAAWLVAQQRRDGSWNPDAGGLDEMGQKRGRAATTAYVAWALAEAGQHERAVVRALRYLERASVSDAYTLGLWAAAATAVGHPARRPLGQLERLAITGDRKRSYRATSALLYASAESSQIQVTALAATALRRAGRRSDADDAMAWIWGARDKTYGWGTTQTTVLALRAAARSRIASDVSAGTLQVLVDGEPVGSLSLSSPELPAIDLGELRSGTHRIALRGGAPGVRMPLELRASWRRTGIPGPTNEGLAVSVSTPRKALIGQPNDFAVRVTNTGDRDLAMPTVRIPVPPGFRADPLSLRALETSVDRVDDMGSELHVYLDAIRAGKTRVLHYRLEAQGEADVAQLPAVAYGYYSPEIRGSSAVRRVRARPRGVRADGTEATSSLRSPAAAMRW